MRKLDIEPLNILPSTNKNDGYLTTFGGITTFLIALLSILAAIAFGRELFEKINPVIRISEEYIDYPVISRKKLNIAVTAMLTGGFKINEMERYLKFRFMSTDTDSSRPEKSKVTNFTLYDPINCNETAFYKEEISKNPSILGSPESPYYCLPDTVNFINLEGLYGNSKFFLWNVVVDYCVNSTLNNNYCKTREEIQNYLKSFHIQVIMPDAYVDNNDLENPIKSKLYSKFLRVSALNQRQDYFYYKLIDYYSDEGIILEDMQYTSKFMISKFETDNLYDLRTTRILRAYWTIDTIKSKIYRSYTKVQMVAANIGGFIKLINIILIFISKKYSILHFSNCFRNYFAKNSSQSVVKSQVILNNFVSSNKNKENSNIESSKKDIKNKDLTIANFTKLNSNEYIKNKNVKAFMKQQDSNSISFLTCIRYYCFCNRIKNLETKRLSKFLNYVNESYSFENLFYLIEEESILKTKIYGDNIYEFKEALYAKINHKIN